MKPHILVIRFSAMGDVAMSVRAVEALRRTYPDLEITVATKLKFARFYQFVPDINILTLPPDGSFRSLWKLMREARKSGVNVVADIHNTIRGKIIRLYFRLHGVRTAHLDKMRAARAALKRNRGAGVVYMRHNVLRFCDVFARAGFPVPEPEAEERIVRPVPEVFGKKTGRWAGYAPFASKALKIYPEAQSRVLAGMMSAEFDRLFIFSGPGKEKEFAAALEAEYDNVTAVFGRTDIWGEIDLMSNLDILVSMDSSAMHMASIVGAPTVTVWGATHPAAGFYAYGSDVEKSCVQLELDCRPCSIYGEGKCRRGDFKCMRDISPEMIMEKIRTLTARQEYPSV